MDLEQIIDDLVYRKKKLDLDSPERQVIDRVLTGLRYSCEEAGGIIEDLDFDWGATCRPLAASPSPRWREAAGGRLLVPIGQITHPRSAATRLLG